MGSVLSRQPPAISSFRVSLRCWELPHPRQTSWWLAGQRYYTGSAISIPTHRPRLAKALGDLHICSTSPSPQPHFLLLPFVSWSLVNIVFPNLHLRVYFWRAQPVTRTVYWNTIVCVVLVVCFLSLFQDHSQALPWGHFCSLKTTSLSGQNLWLKYAWVLRIRMERWAEREVANPEGMGLLWTRKGSTVWSLCSISIKTWPPCIYNTPARLQRGLAELCKSETVELRNWGTTMMAAKFLGP